MYLKEKVINCAPNGKGSRFNSWIDEKDLIEKEVNTFLNRLEVLGKMLTLKLICLIMQQKLI